MYDPDKKILFVHIAKTGGSSISHYYAQSKFPDAPKNADILHPKFIRKYLMINQPHPHCGIKEYEKINNLINRKWKHINGSDKVINKY